MATSAGNSGRPIVGVIAGPTAGGKSALAIDLARRLDGVIINADASQLYADLRVVTARPSVADEALVPHRLYGVLAADDVASAARWAALARAEVDTVVASGRLPLLVGGAGLYLAALLDGLAAVPAIDPSVRALVRAMSVAERADALASADPAAHSRLDPGDSQRRARALEVVLATGKPLAAWQAAAPAGGIAGTHDIRALVVDRPRAELHARAARRFAAMLADGALAEVAALLDRRFDPDLPILRTLGVPELATVIRGEATLAAAEAAAVTATRQYIKRQQTWFRNQRPGWPRVTDADAAAALLAPFAATVPAV